MLLSVHSNKSVDEIVGEFEDFVNKKLQCTLKTLYIN